MEERLFIPIMPLALLLINGLDIPNVLRKCGVENLIEWLTISKKAVSKKNMVTKINEGKTVCSFCGKDLPRLGNSIVCEKCHAIVRVSRIKDSTIFENAKKSMDSIQNYLMNNLDRLHDIEQRDMEHSDLTNEEKSIREFCLEFQNCQSCLTVMIQDGTDTNDIMFRKILYQLLN